MRRLKDIKGIEVKGGTVYMYTDIISEEDKTRVFQIYDGSSRYNSMIAGYYKTLTGQDYLKQSKTIRRLMGV